MLDRISRDLTRRTIWSAAVAFTLVEVSVSRTIFDRGHDAGVLAEPVSTVDLIAYGFVFLLYNAAFLFAFVRSETLGRSLGLIVLAVSAVAGGLWFSEESSVPSNSVVWAAIASVFLSVSSGGFFFAVVRGALVVVARRRQREAAA